MTLGFHVAFGRLFAAISILVAGCVPAGATAMVTVDAWWQLTSTIYEAADGSFYHGCDTRDGDFVFGFVCNGNAAPGDYTEGYPGPGLFKPGDIYTSYYEIVIDAELKGDLPEPTSLPLFATGLGLMGWLAWRRRRGLAACRW